MEGEGVGRVGGGVWGVEEGGEEVEPKDASEYTKNNWMGSL